MLFRNAKYIRLFLNIFLTGFLVFTFVLGIIATISGFYAFINYYSEGHNFTILSFASLGEYLEPAGKLFTLALITATIVAVLMQRETNYLHKIEKFENHFFQLVKIYENIISGFRYVNSDDGREYSQREVFFIIYNKFVRSIEKIYKNKLVTSDNIENAFQEIYNGFYSSNQEYIGHYFRTIYQIIKLIDNQDSNLSFSEKKFYSGILRAQLSSYELLMMFYNCLSKQGEKLKVYVIKYDILKHMDKNLLVNTKKNEFLKLMKLDIE